MAAAPFSSSDQIPKDQEKMSSEFPDFSQIPLTWGDVETMVLSLDSSQRARELLAKVKKFERILAENYESWSDVSGKQKKRARRTESGRS